MTLSGAFDVVVDDSPQKKTFIAYCEHEPVHKYNVHGYAMMGVLLAPQRPQGQPHRGGEQGDHALRCEAGVLPLRCAGRREPRLPRSQGIESAHHCRLRFLHRHFG